MKLKLTLIAIVCTIVSAGCSSSQAKSNAEAVNIQSTSEASASVAIAKPPAPELVSLVSDLPKSSVESVSSYQCNNKNNYLFLGNGAAKNKYNNPIYILHLCIGGKEKKSYKIVTGRNFTQQKNRNQSGTHSPLPNGKYRMSSELTQGMVVEVGRVDGLSVSQPFLPISPMFRTGRSALGIHVDPSYNIDPKEDGTSGCIGLTNTEDFKSLWSDIKRYQIRDLQVAINTKASDNPDVADAN
jgi:hypothetical protein